MDIDNVKTLVEAARAGVAATKIEHNAAVAHYLVATGAGGKIETVNLETGHPHPLRKRGMVQAFDAASFNMILATNADAGDIAIYVDRDPEDPKVVAILNGHGETGPGWGDFRVEIAFRQTPQWAKWKANDGQMMAQVNFAEFIEDNLDDIADPAGAEMLEIAQYLQATRSVNFKSGMRLSSGQVQFQNVEDIQAQVGAGQVAIPEMFTLGIAPLFGVPSYRVPARFRYRIQDGKLKLGYKLQRLETMMETIMEEVEQQLAVGERGTILHGIAPAATK